MLKISRQFKRALRDASINWIIFLTYANMLIIPKMFNSIISRKTWITKKHKNSFCSTTPPKHIFRLSDSATCSTHHAWSTHESLCKPRHKKACLQCKRYLDRGYGITINTMIFLSVVKNRGCVSEEDMSDSVFGFCLLAHHNLWHQLNFIQKTKINTTSK